MRSRFYVGFFLHTMNSILIPDTWECVESNGFSIDDRLTSCGFLLEGT